MELRHKRDNAHLVANISFTKTSLILVIVLFFCILLENDKKIDSVMDGDGKIDSVREYDDKKNLHHRGTDSECGHN